MVKEVEMPQLATFELYPYFFTHAQGVAFIAPVDGATTSGSDYPRSEMRQMRGSDKAAWSNQNESWFMEVELAFWEIPGGDAERGVVAMQVHDGNDDVTVLRLEHNGDLWLTKGDNNHGRQVTGSYVMKTFNKYKIEARKGGGFYWYRDGVLIGPGPVMTGVKSGCYFKFGCYTQANEGNGSGRGWVIVKPGSVRVWRET